MKTYEVRERNRQALAGGRTVWEIPHPAEAKICKVVVVQTGGPAGAFSVTLYNSKLVAAASQSSGGADPAGDYAADPALCQVWDTLPSDSDGRLRKFFEQGVTFANQDGGSTNKERKLYVEIEIPAGGESTTWDVALGGTTDVG